MLNYLILYFIVCYNLLKINFLIIYLHELTHYLFKLCNENYLLDPFLIPVKEI